MNHTRRLEAVEKALAQLLQLEKVCVPIRKDDTPEAALQWYVENGKLNPARQEPLFIMSKIPGVRRPMQQQWKAELPSMPMGKQDEPHPIPPQEAYEPAKNPEPKLEKRIPIHYPEGLAPC
jgi:hypothetical protein